MKSIPFAVDIAALAARLTIAIVLFPHGAQKLLGWFDGHGFHSTMKFFTDSVGLPYAIGVLVILIEFICPLLIIAGIAVRVASTAVLVVMVGIVVTVQNDYFFMNWFGTQSGEGIEFFLLMIGLCVVVLSLGSGQFSLATFRTKVKRTESTT